jgi:thymidylate synthase
MIKADQYYINNLNRIINEGCWDKNPRPKWKDGTPAHSKFITQVFEEYDISKGEFPIPTLRNTAIKTGIREILAIYQQQENTKKAFEKMGVFWWENWFNENNDIGKSYPYNLESHRQNEMKKLVIKIKPRIIDMKFFELLPINNVNPIQNSIDGKIYESKYRNYGEYIIIKKYYKIINNENRIVVDCQFLKTGSISTIREDSLKKNQHPTDNFKRTLCGVGYFGNYEKVKNFSIEDVKILKKMWSRMIIRCYDNTRKVYDNIFVHQEWHSFENFLNDIKYLPQYHLAKENNFKNWELDKDYFGSNCYSKNTCVFLTKKENVLYRKTQIKPIKIKEENVIKYELSYTSLANTLNLSKGYVSFLVKKGKYKNLQFSIVENDDYIYRYELSRNQINVLLKELKENPFGRRHIISFWNWANIDKKELVECAYETLWSVRNLDGNNFLDLTLIQRSNDYIVAGYINKIQYVALLMMIASHLNYKVGKFYHFVNNLHVYDRHFNAMDEILNRKPLDIQPNIKLKNIKSFYEFTIDDFEVINIDGIEKIKSNLELAI